MPRKVNWTEGHVEKFCRAMQQQSEEQHPGMTGGGWDDWPDERKEEARQMVRKAFEAAFNQ